MSGQNTITAAWAFSTPDDVAPGTKHIHRTLHQVQDGRCHYCGCQAPLHPDHVVPKRHGGTDHPSNIVGACRRCNGIKGARSADYFLEHMAARRAAYSAAFCHQDCL